MAKTIKFNLILDGHPVRDLEGLRENFSIEDMLGYFREGLLERWLETRGYEAELDEVQDIDLNENNQVIIKRFIEIFRIPINREDVEKGIAILDYLEKVNAQNKEYKEQAFHKKQIIDDYHAGYTALIYRMREHRYNMTLLKADAIEMEHGYLGLFILDCTTLYYRLSRTAPKAVFAILTRDAFRDYWIGEGADPSISSDINNMLMPASTIKMILAGDLKSARLSSGGQDIWESIETAEVEVMVLKMETDTYVRNAGEYSERLSDKEMNGRFRKLKGLDYQSNNSCELLYMEV